MPIGKHDAKISENKVCGLRQTHRSDHNDDHTTPSENSRHSCRSLLSRAIPGRECVRTTHAVTGSVHHLTTGMWQRPPIHHATFPRKVTHRFRNQPRTTRWPAISCRRFCTNLKPEPLVTHATHLVETLTQDLRSKSRGVKVSAKSSTACKTHPFLGSYRQAARRTTMNGRAGTVTLTRRRRRDRNVAHCANTEFSTYRSGEQVPPTKTHISDLTRFT